MSAPQNSSVRDENALLNQALCSSSSSNKSTITSRYGAFVPFIPNLNSLPEGTMDVSKAVPCPSTPVTVENNESAHGQPTQRTFDFEDHCRSNGEQVGKWQVPAAKRAAACLSTAVVPHRLESAMPSSSASQVPFEAPLVDSEQQNTPQHLAIDEIKGVDMNKTPRQKPRRKKHRPKVIREGKPRRTPKSTPPRSVTPKTPINKEKTPSGKRKYVRKIKVQDPSDKPSHVPEGAAYISSISGTKSTRRRLNFDLETANVRDELPGSALSIMHNEECQGLQACFMETNNESGTMLSMQPAQGVEIVSGNSPNGIQFNPGESLMHKEAEFPSETTPAYEACRVGTIRTSRIQEGCAIMSEDSSRPCRQSKVGSLYEEYCELTRKNEHLTIANPEKSQKSTPDQLNTNQMLNLLLKMTKRRHNFSKDDPTLEEKNGTQIYGSASQLHDASHDDIYLPQGYKKQRTELQQNSFAPSAVTSSVQTSSNGKVKSNRGEQLVFPPEMQYLVSADHSAIRIMDPNNSPNNLLSFSSNKIEESNSSKPRKYIKTQSRRADAKRKPRRCMHKGQAQTLPLSSTQVDMSVSEDVGKKIICTSSTSILEFQSSSNCTESLGGILNSGALEIKGDPLNDITEKLKCLSIDGAYEGYIQQTRSAIVHYNGGGVMVPYEDPKRRRRTRPKVDLDPESNRVWNLLMGKQTSDVDEEMDSAKEKWWEEERQVFHGRVDSFIARMHLVQGDRRFSKWKGSVVDSVVGVFLTQNVSDHLSSSAFMALAARFPASVNNKETSAEKEDSSVQKESCGTFLDDTNKLQKQVLVREPFNHDSLVVVEENETANVNGSYGSNTGGCENNHKKVQSLHTNETVLGADRESPSSVPGIQVILTSSTCAEEAGDRLSVEDMAPSGKPDLVANQRIGLCSSSTVEPETYPFRSLCSGIDSSTSFTELLHIADMMPLMKYDGKTSWFSEVDGRKSMLDLQGDINGRNSPLFASNKSLGESASPSIPNYMEGPSSSRLPGIKTVNITNHNRFSELSINDFNLTDARCGLSENGTTKINQQKSTFVAEAVSYESTIHYCEQVNSSHKESWNKEKNCLHDNLQIHKVEPSITKSSDKFSHVQNQCGPRPTHNLQIEVESTREGVNQQQTSFNNQQTIEGLLTHINDDAFSSKMILTETSKGKSKEKKIKVNKESNYEWDSLRKALHQSGTRNRRSHDTMDSVDWEAVRHADVSQVSETIRERGMNNKLAERIKEFLDRLVRDHGSVDLEWLRDVEPDKSKDYLLSIRGLGLKSVECLRLLTLHHLAFPVDTNVGRICVRLGWVPLQPLPESLQLHLLELYPMLETIQKYLWPRLCKLDQRTLYELHYQMITFGKVFCTKSKPNCNACPMRGECKHFASAFASARLALPGPDIKDTVTLTGLLVPENICTPNFNSRPQPQIEENGETQGTSLLNTCEPIIEEPATPEPECVYTEESAIEDAFYEDPDDIPTIKLNFEEFALNLKSYIQESNKEIQDDDMSKALVTITSQAASIPMPKLKNIRQLRTEHHVYQLPDSHPLLEGFDKREPDDPSPYLLAIWTPGETAQSTEPPEASCDSQGTGNLCNKATCFACNSIREAQAQTVRGTVLIPCRTAMRGSFPLNGTYFQVNELFADHDTSRNPVDVPRNWIWNLPRRTVYFGTSVPTIFKGLTTEEIQQCFWRGFICVRGFDRTTRAPRPLYARLHFPASKARNKKEAAAKTTKEDVQQDPIRRIHPLG